MATISKQTFAFLSELSQGRSKAWFDANRKHYETHLLAPMRTLVETLSVPLAAQIPDLETRPSVNKTLTRINRDMRFARPGQSPYKDNMLALFYRQGRKKVDAQLFVGLQPTEAWMGLYIGPDLISDKSSIAKALIDTPRAVLEMGRSAGIGDDLILATCTRYGETDSELTGSDVAHYRAGPHLCVLARRSAEEVSSDPERFVEEAREILTRLVPLWYAYSETI